MDRNGMLVAINQAEDASQMMITLPWAEKEVDKELMELTEQKTNSGGKVKANVPEKDLELSLESGYIDCRSRHHWGAHGTDCG